MFLNSDESDCGKQNPRATIKPSQSMSREKNCSTDEFRDEKSLIFGRVIRKPTTLEIFYFSKEGENIFF